MSAFIRPLGCIAYIALAAPPVAIALISAYSFFLQHSRLPLSFAFMDLLWSIPELLPVTIPGGMAFIALAFGTPVVRGQVHRRLVRTAVCAFAVVSPFLIFESVKALQGYRPGEHWLSFIAVGLLAGSLLGVMFPQRLLPIAGRG